MKAQRQTAAASPPSRGVFSILPALIGATALASGAALAGDADREAVRCTEIAFSHSVETRDAERFASFLHPDARFVGAGVNRGADAVVKAWAPFFEDAGPELSWRPYYVEVAETGDLALSRGPYRMRTTGADGARVESWGIYNSVWRKEPDGWKIIFDAGNEGQGQLSPEMKQLLEQPPPPCGS